tara:strand:+ start:187 stop:1290 length:1104 start_codon:yes stop_codon:yes gene_type:complete
MEIKPMESITERHVQNGHVQIAIMLAIASATILMGLFAMGVGSSVQLDKVLTLKIILGISEADSLQSDIIWQLRFPRILMAITCGVALATAGALMQGCLGNPLVSPLTLGVASGASLGAALAIVFGLHVTDFLDPLLNSGPLEKLDFGSIGVVVNAFFFSLIVVAIIIQLGRMRSISAESYILVGIAITFICGAIVSTIQYFASDAEISQLTHWSFGSLSRPDLGQTIWIAALIIALMPVAIVFAWDLNSMALGGDDFAISTGVDPQITRVGILVLSAGMTSIVIAFTGLIGFVGLAAPHMTRLVIGNDYRKLLPCSAVTGAFLVLLADTIGRTIFAPIIIPVGVMLSVIGGPFFMYLLLANRGVSH